MYEWPYVRPLCTTGVSAQMDESNHPGPAGQLTDVEHDHAWAKVRTSERFGNLSVGEYACNLCGAVWTL